MEHNGGHDSYGVGLLSVIRKIEELLNLVSFVLGIGRKMRFWLDRWCDKEPPLYSFLPFSVGFGLGVLTF